MVRSLPLNFFVDALEGDEDDVRAMIAFLEDLSLTAASSGFDLRVCLSSRHYPHISIERGLMIVVEDQSTHSQDIQLYVNKKLRGQQYSEIEGLRQDLLKKASGVFLWVVLVVPMLNRVHNQGKGPAQMRAKLNSIPDTLHELFRNILDRTYEDAEECVLLFQWILHSPSPISPRELYTVLRDRIGYESNTKRLTAESAQSRDPEAIKLFLLDCSRGLIELTSSSPPTVQFIHETVRDYLVKRTTLRKTPVLHAVETDSEPDFSEDVCNATIASQCMLYLRRSESVQTDHLKYILQCPTYWQIDLLLKCAIMDYAGKFWWQHVQLCKGNPTIAAIAASLLNKMVVPTWIGSCEPLREDIEAVHELASHLYYASLLGLHDVVLHMLRHGAFVNVTGGRHGTPLSAACRNGHSSVVALLLDNGANEDVRSSLYPSALWLAALGGHKQTVDILLAAGYDVPRPGHCKCSPLDRATNGCHEEIISNMVQQDSTSAPLPYSDEFETRLIYDLSLQRVSRLSENTRVKSG